MASTLAAAAVPLVLIAVASHVGAASDGFTWGGDINISPGGEYCDVDIWGQTAAPATSGTFVSVGQDAEITRFGIQQADLSGEADASSPDNWVNLTKRANNVPAESHYWAEAHEWRHEAEWDGGSGSHTDDAGKIQQVCPFGGGS